MSIMRWTPIRDILSMQEKMNKIFDESYSSSNADFTPFVDILETASEITIMAELAGISEDDINIQVADGLIAISGERKFDEEENKENYYRLERHYGKFNRSFAIPSSIDPANVIASLKDGILKIVLKKKVETPPKEIRITKEK